MSFRGNVQLSIMTVYIEGVLVYPPVNPPEH